MESIKQAKFWSNLFFLIPLAFAVSYNIYWYSIIIALVFLISSYFHFHNEKRIEIIDVASSTVLIFANLVLLFEGHWVFPYSIMAITSAIFALYFYFKQNKRNYNSYHGAWHIFSAAVSFFCVATFLMFVALF